MNCFIYFVIVFIENKYKLFHEDVGHLCNEEMNELLLKTLTYHKYKWNL